MKTVRKWVLAGLLAVFSASTVVSFSPDNAGAAAPVTLYRDGDFTGVSQELEVGFYNVQELEAGAGNDKLSSLRVAPGYRVTLYKDYNYSGAVRAVTADARWLDDFNDETSSLKIEAIGGPHKPVTVYSNSPYGGFEQTFDVGSYDWAELDGGVGNDSISSLRVAQGYKVTLYRDANFAGQSKSFSADAMYVDEFNDLTSSLTVEAVSPLDDAALAVPGNSYSDDAKRAILEAYAPRIWFAEGEVYFPSSVEYTFPHVERYLNADSGKYELRTRTALNPYDQKLPYFSGDPDNAPIYSFWVEKEYSNVDLVYFQFSPYDLGKTVLGTEVGSHVGDFERITVRLAKFEYNGMQYMKPIQVFYGAHSFGTTYRWDEVDKIDGTHPIAYSAFGSHGMWKDPGNHVYQNIVVAQLTDVANQGTAWDTWNSVQAFEFFPLSGTGVGLGNPWPSWLDKDYENPDGGAVYRFGNPSQGSFFGQPLLAYGPTGPQEKTALTSDVMLD